MWNYYSLLGVEEDVPQGYIKKAFREKAKQIHPDITGREDQEAMRRLLTAYETLSDPRRRLAYDRAYRRFAKPRRFDYREFLRERPGDPESQAKLIFFDLLHLEEDEALEIWETWGGLNFPLERHLDREDWMDCAFILAEELEKRRRYYESFTLLAALVREERRRPYFRHFMEDVEGFLRELVRLKLKSAVDGYTYADCLRTLLGLGFPRRDEARWLRSLAETLLRLGEKEAAREIFREAPGRESGPPGTALLRRPLKI